FITLLITLQYSSLRYVMLLNSPHCLVCVCVCVCVSVWVSRYVCVFSCVFLSVCEFVSVCVSLYLCAHMHTAMHTQLRFHLHIAKQPSSPTHNLFIDLGMPPPLCPRSSAPFDCRVG